MGRVPLISKHSICDPNAPRTNKDKEFMLIGHIQCDKSLSLILLFAYETQLCASPRGCWNTSILVAACYDSQLVQALAPSAKNHNAL